MFRFFKTLLVFLLVLALPLQGFAAAMKMSCGPVHVHAAPAVVMQDIPVLQEMQAMQAMHHHEHGATHVHVSNNDASATDHKPAAHKHTTASCGVCPACGFSALAPPAPVIAPPAFTIAALMFIAPANLLTGFIPSGLERPPKPISA